jgi:hypothetical protein
VTEPPDESLKEWLKAIAIGVVAVIGMGVVVAIFKALDFVMEAL